MLEPGLSTYVGMIFAQHGTAFKENEVIKIIYHHSCLKVGEVGDSPFSLWVRIYQPTTAEHHAQQHQGESTQYLHGMYLLTVANEIY
ncbi:MAG: hypothetical protein J7M40_12190 [Planctomycetes bacterium]|nr:hypothetical protein [Planctomycetota bacterium]